MNADEEEDFWDKAERGDFDSMTPEQLEFLEQTAAMLTTDSLILTGLGERESNKPESVGPGSETSGAPQAPASRE